MAKLPGIPKVDELWYGNGFEFKVLEMDTEAGWIYFVNTYDNNDHYMNINYFTKIYHR